MGIRAGVRRLLSGACRALRAAGATVRRTVAAFVGWLVQNWPGVLSILLQAIAVGSALLEIHGWSPTATVAVCALSGVLAFVGVWRPPEGSSEKMRILTIVGLLAATFVGGWELSAMKRSHGTNSAGGAAELHRVMEEIRTTAKSCRAKPDPPSGNADPQMIASSGTTTTAPPSILSINVTTRSRGRARTTVEARITPPDATLAFSAANGDSGNVGNGVHVATPPGVDGTSDAVTRPAGGLGEQPVADSANGGAGAGTADQPAANTSGTATGNPLLSTLGTAVAGTGGTVDQSGDAQATGGVGGPGGP